ncbi:DUF4279 domain-containing protein [Paraburkholderia sp. RL17-368-BIF-A]|jgi:hypothetical protein|uniref:DUF4279 domain-containing protein n=1 Tax=Paraburkholderia sp. RL17-368-BIF-A TaxID=3031628 RepID=UPI0006B3F7A4|nr:hypothetical protein AC233_33555 [Burkholderia sp. HB1]
MSVHQLAHATFSIAGDDIVPESWTRYFGVVPDVAITKGDPVIDPTGQRRQFTRRTGVWSVRSKSAIQSDHLEPHLRYLVERLGLPRPDLRDLLKTQSARVRFFCYWFNEPGHCVPDVPDDIRAMMESMGGIVDIDEYR